MKEENEAAGKDFKFKLGWRQDGQFNLRVNFYSYFEGPYVEIGLRSFSAMAQMGMSATFSDTFRGAIEQEVGGGCTVRGRLHPLWVYGGLFLVCTVPQLLIGLLEGVDMLSLNIFWLWSLVGAVIGIRPCIDIYRYCDSKSDNQWLIAFLEDCSIKWQEAHGITEK